MENKKVMIENLSSSGVSINVPDIKLKVSWERKGAVKPIMYELLEQAIYDPGVEYMFKEGILNIADLEVKKALGLEPDDAKEPVNIIILTDNQRKRLLSVVPTDEFRKTVEKLSYEQKRALADYAIENKLVDIEKAEVLKKATGQDILRAIQLNEMNNKEENK